MRQLVMIAAVLALSVSPALAASSGKPASTKPAPAGPFKLDAKGGCHAANGQLAPKAMCTATTPAKPARCKDAKTKKFAECGTPGAVPA